MVFSSTTFLFLFLPLLILAYYMTGNKGRIWKNLVLLSASLVFYAWGEPLFVFLMMITVIVNWFIVFVMHSCNGSLRKIWCCVAIAVDLGLLFVFKYASFLSENVAVLMGRESLAVNIALPIGISFFTFQMMSYVFDVYYRKTEPQRNLFQLMLYISFFPQLIAGPIVRYDTIAGELKVRKENWQDFSYGMIRFTYGLGKKVLLANFLAVPADTLFDETGRSLLGAWLGALCYTLQIYFDFSGYSDMAIGLGRMFGFHFPENFEYPYIAKSITEFWRRWHISLSQWFRDYVYIPLGGNRVGKARWVGNLFIVWLLTGIWHGANWTFLVWGMFYFAVLLAEKVTGCYKCKKWYMHVYTMMVVILAWVIFRADSIGAAIGYIGNMFGVGTVGITDVLALDLLQKNAVVILCAVLLSLPITKILEKKMKEPLRVLWTICTSAVIFITSIFACVASTYQPFIYFNF